jgi:hypothetical protein
LVQATTWLWLTGIIGSTSLLCSQGDITVSYWILQVIDVGGLPLKISSREALKVCRHLPQINRESLASLTTNSNTEFSHSGQGTSAI